MICGVRYSCSAPTVRSFSSTLEGANLGENRTGETQTNMTASDGQITRVSVAKNTPKQSVGGAVGGSDMPQYDFLGDDVDSLTESLTSEMLANSVNFVDSKKQEPNSTTVGDDFEINVTGDDSADLLGADKIAGSGVRPQNGMSPALLREVESVTAIIKSCSSVVTGRVPTGGVNRDALTEVELHFLIGLYESRLQLHADALREIQENG